MPEYKLDFPVSVGSPAPVRSLADAVREVADRTKLGEGNLKLFSSILSETAQRTGSLKSALSDLASKQNMFQEFAKNVQTYARETEKAQNETQKLGRMMEQAYGENAKRNLDALKKSQQEAQKETQQLGRDLQNLSRALPGGGGIAGQGLAGLFGAGGGPAAALAAGGAGLVALITGAAAAMLRLASETGEYAREQQNLSTRTGLTVRETQEFSQIAQVAGVNVGSLTTSMRTLSKGLSENSEEGKQAKQALKELGLDSSVAFEPTGRAMKEIFSRLGDIGSGLERDRLAIALFGRGGLELLPMVEQFKELEARVQSAGNVMDEAGIKKAAEYQRQVTLLGQSWDQLKRTMGEKAIGIIQLQMGGRDLTIGNIADWFFTGGLVGKYNSPGGPQTPGLAPGMPDPFALMKQQRSEQVASVESMTGTPRQRLEAQLKAAEGERQSVSNRYIESGKPEDLQKIKDLDKTLQTLQARLDGLKKTAVSFSEELARFANRGESNELARKLAENREAATALERQFPTRRSDIEAQANRNAYGIVDESLKKQGEKNTKDEIAQAEARLKIEESITAEYEKRLKNQTPAVQQILEAGQLITAPIPLTAAQLAARQRQSLSLSQAVNSGALARARTSGAFSSSQLSGMELHNQLSDISQSSNIDVGQFSQQAAGFREQASNATSPKEALEYLREASDAAARAEDRKTQANIQAVEAINRFQEAAAEASAHIRDEFANFASGLVGAARNGNAGTFSRDFMLGQFDKIVGNAAGGLYKPGMLQFPGVGSSPAIEKLFQGTMFGKDPLASKNQPVIKATDDNTKATLDNTTILAAVYQALGGDPSTLGLTGSSSASIPFFGGSGGSPTAGLASLVSAAGISIPGLTSSGGAFESGGGSSSSPLGGLGGILKSLTKGSPGGGFSSSNPDMLSGSDWGFPDAQANVTGNSNPFSNSIEGPLFSSDSTTGAKVGAGVGTAAALYGGFQGVQQITKGGAQNITGGISKIAGTAAELDPEPISKGILAGVALVSGIVGSLMGDPKANRQASINHELFNNQYLAPVALNRSMDVSGNYSDVDFRGNARGSDLSSIPTVYQASPDPRHGVVAPGYQVSPFGGGGNHVTVNNNISAIDQDSVAKFFQTNPQALGDGVVNAINKGGTDLANRLRTI
jgi:hypothetical protein